MKIDNVRQYIALCPYLDNLTILNVDYIGDGVISYSITENASYNPLINKDIVGNEYCQFLFNFDAKLRWTEETQNNVNNSNFFNNFSSWIKQKNDNKQFPSVDEGVVVDSIRTLSNGYIFATDSDEAIYRISCEITYRKNK